MTEKGMDITGIGEVARAIPEKSWNRMVSTACDTFEKTLAPITEFTGGVGRLISPKFDRFVEAEKILAAETLKNASEKITKIGKVPRANFKPDVLLSALAESTKQTDSNIRELWANLIAQELLDGSVHPEVVSLLKRLTTEDAQTLAKIAEESPKDEYITSFKSSVFGIKSSSEATISLGFLKATIKKRPQFSFSEKLLESLNLIEMEEGKWVLTAIGQGFIASVTEPFESDFT